LQSPEAQVLRLVLAVLSTSFLALVETRLQAVLSQLRRALQQERLARL
jgi:hypothetical protein